MVTEVPHRISGGFRGLSGLLSNHLYDHGGNPGRWKILIFGVKERFDRAETSLSQGRKILTLPMVGVSGSSGVRMRRF